MADREKVMTGLELCTNISPDGCLMLCPYKDEKDETYSGFCEQVLKQDALALLKELEEQIKNRDESLEKAREEIKWLRGMLKEQEAKQVIRRQCKTEHPDGSIDYYAEWFCPHCNSLLKRGFDAAWIEYCFKCGKPILWEGR